MNRLLLTLILLNGLLLNTYSQNAFTVKTDPRVELLSIVFMLAENPEYNRAHRFQYKEDVKAYFEKFKEHEVVKLAVKNRSENGVSYDAVINFALNISDAFEPAERIPFGSANSKLERRWKPENAKVFLEALRRFIVDTDFKKFVQTHSELYNTTDQKLTELISQNARLEWYDTFFGEKLKSRFILVPGYLTGGGNYGGSFNNGNNDEIYSITAFSYADKDGIPVFDKSTASTVIHEFNHSYVNHIVEKYMDKLSAAGSKIYSCVSEQMKSQAYGSWQTMINESVVRACVNRYLMKYSGAEASQNDIKYNFERGFLWIEDLVTLFNEYENNRTKFSSLDSFMPKIIELFNNYSKIIKEKAESVEKEKTEKIKALFEKGPKMVSISPANGDTNVDPSTEYITITFDREMINSWAFLIGKYTFPKTVGTPVFENGNKTLRLKVKLSPATEYDFSLNGLSNLGFKCKDGFPLAPVYIKFKTK